MTAKNKQQPVDEQLLLSAAKHTLDESVNNLDAETLDRLAAIRLRAIASANQGKKSSAFEKWIMPAGSFVTAAVLVVAVMLWSSASIKGPEPVAVLEDIKLLTDSEDLEFYQELEFYQWLAVNEQATS
ncbi:hypothetical protein [Kaarinaea lacus]